MTRLYFLISFLIIAVPAKAQILNIDKMAPTLELAPMFLDSLEKCSDYNGGKSTYIDGTKAKISYKISKKDNQCALQVVAETDHYVHIEQNCLLPLKTAARYAKHLRDYTAKKYSLIKDTFKLNEDEDYIEASDIMQNSDLCTFTRDEIDNTRDIRDNLPNCQPFQTEEKVQNGSITRRIDGLDKNSNCRYYFTLWVPKPKISAINMKSEKERQQLEKLKDKKFIYACAFDNHQRREYIRLLESLVLPEEEGYDFTSVTDFSNKAEIEYIIRNCEYIVPKNSQ